MYKYSHNITDPNRTVNLNRTIHGRPSSIGVTCNMPKQIISKWKNYKCRKKEAHIVHFTVRSPPIYHIFYTELRRTNSNAHEDIHGFSENLNFELN